MCAIRDGPVDLDGASVQAISIDVEGGVLGDDQDVDVDRFLLAPVAFLARSTRL